MISSYGFTHLGRVLSSVTALVDQSVSAAERAISAGCYGKPGKHPSASTSPEYCAEALRHARLALAKAESAFFGPSLVPQLYFPDEHIYAVYLPLILPLMLPLLISGVGETRRMCAKIITPGNQRKLNALRRFRRRDFIRAWYQ